MRKGLSRIVAFTAVSLYLVGCATPAANEEFRMQVSAWIGRSADSLVVKLGAPVSTYVMDNGGKVLKYSWHDEYDLMSGGRMIRDCELNIQVDTAGVIKDAQYHGRGGTVYDSSESVCKQLAGERLRV